MSPGLSPLGHHTGLLSSITLSTDRISLYRFRTSTDAGCSVQSNQLPSTSSSISIVTQMFYCLTVNMTIYTEGALKQTYYFIKTCLLCNKKHQLMKYTESPTPPLAGQNQCCYGEENERGIQLQQSYPEQEGLQKSQHL